jgi:integrating conjugative element protein (TIGR03758 family)
MSGTLSAPEMNDAMREAFQSGSGVDPARMKAVIAAIAAGVILAVALWIFSALFDAYRNNQLTQADVFKAFVQLLAIASLMLYLMV